MTYQNLSDAIAAACAAVGIHEPGRIKRDAWIATQVIGKGRGNTSGRVKVSADGGLVIAHNWASGAQEQIRIDGGSKSIAPAFDREAIARKERQRREEAAITEIVCARIVRSSRSEPHPYLERKGFPHEECLVHDDPRAMMPDTPFGDVLRKAVPDADGPLLIVPGWVGKTITTVQFIAADGQKKNLYRGRMGGASYRIAAGKRRTIVCEGIATALSVRAALRFMGQNWTVLTAFSASNVAKVASAIPDAVIAADNDKPIEMFGGIGTGEYYARQTGLTWVMPPDLGDFNDMHMAHELRDVAIYLRDRLRL